MQFYFFLVGNLLSTVPHLFTIQRILSFFPIKVLGEKKLSRC
jgi:hypothetical protein